jgi:hypothetical protein
MRIYAGFMKAERKDGELVTIPMYCIADDEQHARSTLRTKALERWPIDKGWKYQQAWVVEVDTYVLFMDERVIKVVNVATFM